MLLCHSLRQASEQPRIIAVDEQDGEWVNFSRLSQHLYETFYKLKPRHLGPKDKKYKSLLKFIADYPDDFEVRQDDDKKGLYWVRLFQNNT